MKPMFSIIVPIYKVENYLIKCIESILNQKNNNYELILVDDGSPDNCPKICDEYKKKYEHIKVIHKKNEGLVSARKAGCSLARGEYILNVDGDDWIKDDYLDKIGEIVKTYNPDVVCFGYILSWENREEEYKLPYEKGYYDKQKIMSNIYPILIESNNGTYFSPTIWSKAIKRDLYNQYQMQVDNRISIGEDSACIKPIIFESCDIYIVDECLYYYRQNEASMTKNKKAYNLQAPILIANIFDELIKFEGVDEQICRNFTHNMFNAVLSQFNRKESKNKIINDIEQVLKQEKVMEYISKSKYNLFNWKGNLAKYSLKWRLYWLIGLFNKF